MSITPERLNELRALAEDYEDAMMCSGIVGDELLALLDLIAEKDAEVERLDATIFKIGRRADLALAEVERLLGELANVDEVIGALQADHDAEVRSWAMKLSDALRERDRLNKTLAAVEALAYELVPKWRDKGTWITTQTVKLSRLLTALAGQFDGTETGDGK